MGIFKNTIPKHCDTLCKFKISMEFFLHFPTASLHCTITQTSKLLTSNILLSEENPLLGCQIPFHSLQISARCHYLFDLLWRHFPFLSTCCMAMGLILLPGTLQAPFSLRAFAHAISSSLSVISLVFFKSGSYSSSKSSLNSMCLETTFLTTLSMCSPLCYSERFCCLFLSSNYNLQLCICLLTCFSLSTRLWVSWRR